VIKLARENIQSAHNIVLTGLLKFYLFISTKLVEALCCKREGRGFGSYWGHELYDLSQRANYTD
jgi:hypothetical protein